VMGRRRREGNSIMSWGGFWSHGAQEFWFPTLTIILHLPDMYVHMWFCSSLEKMDYITLSTFFSVVWMDQSKCGWWSEGQVSSHLHLPVSKLFGIIQDEVLSSRGTQISILTTLHSWKQISTLSYKLCRYFTNNVNRLD
jgi:hypothetical protein